MTDDEIIKALEGCSCDTLELALDLINRQKAEIERNRRIIKMHEAVIEILEKDYIPAADVEPVKHGRWNDFYGDYKVAKCSKCSEEYEVSDTNAGLAILFKAFKEYYKFCPKCGTRMDGEDEDN